MPESKSTDLTQTFIRACDQITTLKTRFEDIPTANHTKGMLIGRKEGLEVAWAKVSSTYDRLYSGESALEINDLLPFIDKYNKIQEDYYSLIGSILDAIDNIPTNTSVNPGNNALPNSNLNFRLPSIVIPTFNGHYEMWRSFRDIFTSVIINNSKLSPVERFYYLLSNVENRPKDLVSKFPMENASFDIAWNVLVKEYENKRVLVHAQLNLLFSIQPAKSENPASIRLLQDTINDCLSALKTLDVDTGTWDPILVYLATQKLPNLTHALRESKLEGSMDLEKWEVMNNFLSTRFRTLEALNEKKTLNLSASSSNSIKPNDSKIKTFHIQGNNCLNCSESGHSIYSCPKFQKCDPKKRFDIIKAKKLCINCLGSHKSNQCSSKSVCQKCSKRHHTSLHFTRDLRSPKPLNASTSSQPQCNINQTSNPISNSSNNIQTGNVHTPFMSNPISSNSTLNPVHSNLATNSRRILLATAVVHVKVRKEFIPLRALIDQGSESSFILDSVVQSLRIPTKSCSAQISGVGYSLLTPSNKFASVELYSRNNHSHHISFDVLVLPRISGILPSQEIPISELIGFEKLQLADPTCFKPGEIHMLLGADIFPQIIRSKLQRFNNFIAQESIFGYIISGSMSNHYSGATPKIKVLSFFNNVLLNQTLEKFWEVEDVPLRSLPSPEDLHCENHFLKTHYRRSDGRFVVELPFKKEYPSQIHLSRSRDIALRRFESTSKHLAKNESYQVMYDNVIREYVELGHMVECPSKEKVSLFDNHPVFDSYYLPHHGVYKAQSLSTKLRIVFDASCKSSNGKSLNDVLYSGPPLQSKIIDVLNRIRLYPFIYNCDIKMMYRQIMLSEKHTDFHRILYRNSINSIQDYKMLTVTFGVSSSPYLAMRCLKQLALTEQDKYPLASKILEESTYVDDIFAGFFNLIDAKNSQKELIDLLLSAGFELRKWTANKPELLTSIPFEFHADPNLHNEEENSFLKTLGILFNHKHDYYTFRPQRPKLKYPLTKRKVFSEIAKLYDPAGWLAPVIIKPKILIQDIWKDNTGWDDCIKQERVNQWEMFVQDIQKIEKIRIPRWFHYLPEFRVEIHGFCDASVKAYAACVYFRAVHKNQIYTTLISAKTKVAPIKTISLPRLELSGALLLSKLIKSTKETFKLSNSRYFAWTDSTIVLAWLRKSSSCWKTFVANRVSIISENCGDIIWNHVTSDKNPADIASRGLNPSDLIDNKIWFEGPDFLKLKNYNVSESRHTFETNLEAKLIHSNIALNDFGVDNYLQKFSNFSRAIRIISYQIRFFKVLLKNPTAYSSIHISQIEFKSTLVLIIKLLQKKYFFVEYNCLLNKKPLPKKSILTTLNPFIDEHQIMRVNGRLSNLTLPIAEKFPIIIPHNSHFSQLLFNHYHSLTLHGNLNLMLATIRKVYWIPRLKQCLRNFIHHCKRCFLERKEVLSQIMAPLPVERLLVNKLFCSVGVDFGGPVTLLRYEGRCNSTTKGYICLFVCFSTKAIHLEAVSDLTTIKFLQAFERFFSRRGLCKNIYLDNATNFVGANNALTKEYQKAIKNATEQAAAEYASREVNFNFNCPLAAHMNGLAEAGIKSVKFHLKRILGTTKITFENLSTLLCRIEACLNSRPLTPKSDDPDDLEPITPGHFIRGNALLAPPEPALEINENTNCFKILDNIDKMKLHFWRRWKDEYLHRLQQRSKWCVPQRNIKINDLVVLKDKNSSPQNWAMGRIIKVYPGGDGHVRIVDVRTRLGIFRRAISQLSLLPYDREDTNSSSFIF